MKIVNIISILLFFSLIVLSCSSVSEKNFINGSFEKSYDGESPDGWFANNLPHAKKYAVFAVDKTVFHSGGNSILISLDKKLPDESFTYNWARRIDGLKPSGVYQLQGWIKTREIKNSPYIEIQCWNSRTDQLVASISTKSRFQITGTSNWKRVDMIIKIPSGIDKVLLIAGVPSKNNDGGKVWFDDISISQLEKLSKMEPSYKK